jgi:protein-tyrosine phosphatase
MGEVIDWQTVAEPRAVLRRAARALRSGRLVLFPTETGHALAASALRPDAVERLSAKSPLPLVVRSVAEARDWAPDMSMLAQRLARRFWPGPLLLSLTEGVSNGLARRLPDAVRRRVSPDDSLHLRAPGHEAPLEVLRYLPEPMLLEAAGDDAVERADLALVDGPCAFPEGATVVQVTGAAWQVQQAGAVSEEMVRRNAATMLVFVCTGNTCRSPLAEALLKKRLADRLGCGPDDLPGRGYHVLSAGLAAAPGAPAADAAQEVARTYGADLAGHNSRPLSAELAAQADYLIGMTHSHVYAMKTHFSPAGCRPRLLDPEGRDLSDPIGCERSVYEECGRQIWSCLTPLLEELV